MFYLNHCKQDFKNFKLNLYIQDDFYMFGPINHNALIISLK